ncbi:hypothetical protein [Planktosalinus lacus]|uniref:Uncharacterized protein n=1 Tax=Planktosalinus lacus TaxID=1526573 RepID=A0A8J2V942_9FLAO|nr:hypothetical protein [Planktosalinus lacus]GGD85911.1 hypothetical protein GCM10011312_07410 [Planktosalinus lacus]
MRKDHNLPTNPEILNHLETISEHPERVRYFDRFILKETLIFIDKLIEKKLLQINNQLLVCSDEHYPKEYLNGKEFDFWAENIYQYGFNYIGLKKLRELILKELTNPFEVNSKNFNDKIFENFESETFFKFIVQKWMSDKKNSPTKISYLFAFMWTKSGFKPFEENLFKIVCSTKREFAVYWNKKYSEIINLKIKVDTPNLKHAYSITSKRYEREFKGLLDDFLKENKIVD